jgi:hypothetical protein
MCCRLDTFAAKSLDTDAWAAPRLSEVITFGAVISEDLNYTSFSLPFQTLPSNFSRTM